MMTTATNHYMEIPQGIKGSRGQGLSKKPYSSPKLVHLDPTILSGKDASLHESETRFNQHGDRAS